MRKLQAATVIGKFKNKQTKTMIPYTPPTFNKSAFNCPHCGAYANQFWSEGYFSDRGIREIKNFKYSACTHCSQYVLWHDKKMVFPDTGGAPMSNNDLPEELKLDYEEARTILNKSPRGAAALLRLCIQKLCKHLGEYGKDINKDIGNLVKKGLPVKVQQSLDIVRVIGNDAVHPGQIDLTDDIETATKLFVLINFITDVMITQPKEVDKLFNSLPANKLDGIKDRDK
ncbi:MAG: hypothetical protein ACD_19C00201G0002 [uncultured bacterium]|nr:MAG: hypothetical protein ACD_19C00201G0002 [uncultured bacterium]